MAAFEHSTTGAQVVEYFKDKAKDRIILITGPSDGGIGAETAFSLAAASPACILLAGRSLLKIQPVIDHIKRAYPDVETRFISLDLSSQQAIREAAGRINESIPAIDILINNAAIMACPFAKTADGIESQFGTNFIGHFLLTNLVMERLFARPGSRIVNVSSSAHRMSDLQLDGLNLEDENEYNPFVAYARAKTANLLFTVALAGKLRTKHVDSISLHPGSIKTNLQTYLTPAMRQEAIKMLEANTGRPFVVDQPKSVEQGCSTSLVAALDPTVPSGSYLEDCIIAESEAYARDQEKARSLWALGERLVGQTFTW